MLDGGANRMLDGGAGAVCVGGIGGKTKLNLGAGACSDFGCDGAGGAGGFGVLGGFISSRI
jgi:hypothetical protein